MSGEQRNRIREAKRAVSVELLRIDGVTGVGVSDDSLNVYVAGDDAETKQRVQNVLNQLAPGIPVRFVITGRIKPC